MLSNKDSRQKYDAIRQFGMGGARFAGGAGGGGFDAGGFSDIFGSMFGGGNGSHIRFQTNGGGPTNINDIFSMFGGGAGPAGGAYGGSPYGGYQFRQAVKGATVSLSVDGKKFKTHIPAGVKDGQKIRLAGKGKPGRNGGKAGDLYLELSVKPDDRFTLRDRDIVMTLPVTVGEAVCGAKVEARDIDGESVTFKVPAGSSSGTEVRVSGKGVQASRGTGDLIGRVEIRVPAKPGMGLKRAAKDFDKESGGFADELASQR